MLASTRSFLHHNEAKGIGTFFTSKVSITIFATKLKITFLFTKTENLSHVRIFLLSSYFQHSKFTSFQRQLNLYGFCRIRSGQDKGGYYHLSFVMGRPELTYGIKYVLKQNSMNVPNEIPSLFHDNRGTIEESKMCGNDSSPSSISSDQAKLQIISNIRSDYGSVNDPSNVRSDLMNNLYYASHRTSSPPLLEIPKNNTVPCCQHPIFSSSSNPNSDPRRYRPIPINFGNSETNAFASRQTLLNSLILANLMKDKRIMNMFAEIKR
jgi:HSF-type DNA-binding